MFSSSPTIELKNALGEIKISQNAIGPVMQQIEAQFVSIGKDLQQLTQLGDQLQQQNELISFTTGVNGEFLLDSSLSFIQEQTQFIHQAFETNTVLIQKLESFLQEATRLQNSESSLDRIIAPLKTISILFKIHSVMLTAEEHQFFEGLTRDIGELEAETKAKAHEKFALFAKASESLSKSLPILKNESQKCLALVLSKKQTIEASLAARSEEISFNRAQQENLFREGQEIAQATSNVVVALQHQDIVRQKWEHVDVALCEMQEHFDARNDAPNAKKTEDWPLLKASCALQYQQIQTIREDLTKAETTLSTGIKSILSRLDQMASQCRQMCNKDGDDKTVHAMIESLLRTLSDVHQLAVEIAKITQATCEVAQVFDQTATDVAGILRRMSDRMRLVAVNAQVQTNHVGTDTGLNVLSESIHQVAKEIHSFSTTTGTDFDRIISGINQTIEECRQLHDEANERQRSLQSAEPKQKENLKRYSDGIHEKLQEISKFLDKTQEEAARAHQNSAFHSNSSAFFEQVQQALENAATLASRKLRSAPAILHDPSHLDKLKQRYTMESERALHASVVAGNHMVVPAASTIAHVTDKTEEEFFFTSSENQAAPADARQATQADKSEASKKNSQFSTTQPATVTDTKSEFGDNVDLF